MVEQKFKTSFIPKKQAQPSHKIGRVVKSGASLMTVIATVIFIISLIAAGVVFAYKYTLKGKVESQKQDLIKAKQGIDPVFIANATRLNDRIKSVQSLIDKHVAPSQLFTLLENETLKTVRFNSLQYFQDDDGNLGLEISGEAKSYQSIVLQSDRYGFTGKIRDVLFSGLQPIVEENIISFDFEGLVEPAAVLYSNLLNAVPIQEDNNNEE
jgi:hypothetical protein